jgi:hypothetical protein
MAILGGLGGFLGGVASTIANLTMITTMTNIPGGMEGLANQGAQLLGLPQPYQGPPPEQQAQIAYQQQMANMPQTVRSLGLQTQTQADQFLQMASDPGYLQSQDQLQAAQQVYQRAQQRYDSQHYISPQQALMGYQEQQYDQQQMQNYAYQQQNPGPVDIPGYWGGVAGGIGASWNNFFGGKGVAANNLTGPPSTPFDPLFNGVGSFFGGAGQMFNNLTGGIGQDWNNLFGGGAQTTPASGGCFTAGTRVLMANGAMRPIEDVQIGDKVLAYDGEKQVSTSVLALIKPPPKRVYKLTFSDGHTLTLTNSHPISSPSGWKSISPSATEQENPGLVTTALQIGDSVHTADGITTLTSILPLQGVRQVFNIEVDAPHTFYANNVLVHNKTMGSSGVGSEQVSLSHTFTANVSWAANNLEKSFTGVASWAAQGLAKTFQGIASWVGQGLANTFNGIASWVGQGLSNTFNGIASWVGQGLANTFNGVANWIGQNLENTFNGVASWIGQGLSNTFNGVASWVGQGLSNTFKGVASWIGQGLEHTFNAVANWTAQNLTPNFTVHPSVTMLAEGTSNWGGGPAVVGESGMEMVESNGQYTLFDQGAALVNLPAGSNVYPMKDISSYSSPTQFADGTGGGTISLPIDIRGQNASMPSSMNIYLMVDGQTFWSATGVSFAQNARVQSGNRAF